MHTHTITEYNVSTGIENTRELTEDEVAALPNFETSLETDEAPSDEDATPTRPPIEP